MNMNQIWIALSYKMSTIFCLDIKSTNPRLEKTRSLKCFMLRAENKDMKILKVNGYIF